MESNTWKRRWKSFIYDGKAMVKVLGVASFLMIAAQFVPNSAVSATGLLLYTLNVIWLMYILFVRGYEGGVTGLAKNVEVDIVTHTKEHRHFRAGVSAVAIPLCVVGIVKVFMLIVVRYLA